MALTIIPFSFQNLYASNQSRELLELNSVKATEKQLPNYFLQADFSLSEKLHLEPVWLLILHAIPCGSFAAAETIPDLAYTFGKYGHREQDSPIDLLKQDDLCVH
jgi:iron complex outermembrane receptor protein